ncbi:MAG: type II secretion system protein J [Candidatus Methylacidiphilales bacterium]|nr:hypothetical protein [Candidatus Methylacidiphilales bacterium]
MNTITTNDTRRRCICIRSSGDLRCGLSASRVQALARARARVAAFTLVEMIVSVGVLALLMLMVAQLVHSGNLAISGSRKRLSADAQAREVFSRFEMDIRRMPLRADVDFLLSANNRVFYFFTEAPGFYSGSTAQQGGVALAGYRVSTNGQLERLGKGLGWTNTLFLTYPVSASTNATPLPASTLPTAWAPVIGTAPLYQDGADSDYHVLADGVFTAFYCFQKKDGTYALTPDYSPSGSPSATNAALALSGAGRFRDASAIVLTLAVMDGDSRKIIADFKKLAAAMPQPVQADMDARTLPAQRWQAALENPVAFATAAGIPASAVGRIRIYQRSFPLFPQ